MHGMMEWLFGWCACSQGFMLHWHQPLSFWITEEYSWTPSCHAMMWMECDHPLAREPDWAKGISHRHANSTNAPVRPKWQTLSAMGFSIYFCMCVQHSLEKELSSSAFSRCTSHCIEIAIYYWCGIMPWLKLLRLPSWEESKYYPGTGSLSLIVTRYTRKSSWCWWSDFWEQHLCPCNAVMCNINYGFYTLRRVT